MYSNANILPVDKNDMQDKFK